MAVALGFIIRAKTMSKRFTETAKWDDAWFLDLSPLSKLVWFYLCDNCSRAGIIDLSLRKAAACLSGRIDAVSEGEIAQSIDELGDRIERAGNRILIVNFIRHQYPTGLNQANKAHRSILTELDMNKGAFKILPSSFQGAKETDKETDKETTPPPSESATAISAAGNLVLAMRRKSPNLEAGKCRNWVDAEIKHGATESQILELIDKAPANFYLWQLKPDPKKEKPEHRGTKKWEPKSA